MCEFANKSVACGVASIWVALIFDQLDTFGLNDMFNADEEHTEKMSCLTRWECGFEISRYLA